MSEFPVLEIGGKDNRQKCVLSIDLAHPDNIEQAVQVQIVYPTYFEPDVCGTYSLFDSKRLIEQVVDWYVRTCRIDDRSPRRQAAIRKALVDKLAAGWLGRQIGAWRKKILAQIPERELAVMKWMYSITGGKARYYVPRRLLDDKHLYHDLMTYIPMAVIAFKAYEYSQDADLPLDYRSFFEDWREHYLRHVPSRSAMNKTIDRYPRQIPPSLTYDCLPFLALSEPCTDRLALLLNLLWVKEVRDFARVNPQAGCPEVVGPLIRRESQAQIMDILEHYHRNVVAPRYANPGRMNVRSTTYLSGFTSYLRDALAVYDYRQRSLRRWYELATESHRQYFEMLRNMRRPDDVYMAQYPDDLVFPLPPWPLPQHEGIRFLSTAGDLRQESATMEHCVRQYVPDAAQGLGFFFHVEHDGHKATVLLDAAARVMQVHGPRNEYNDACKWARNFFAGYRQKLSKLAKSNLTNRTILL